MAFALHTSLEQWRANIVPQAVTFRPPSCALEPGWRIEIQICEPHHQEQNGFAERFNRTSQEEWLACERPKSLEEARRVTETFQQHYNFQRPNQALS